MIHFLKVPLEELFPNLVNAPTTQAVQLPKDTRSLTNGGRAWWVDYFRKSGQRFFHPALSDPPGRSCGFSRPLAYIKILPQFAEPEAGRFNCWIASLGQTVIPGCQSVLLANLVWLEVVELPRGDLVT